MRRVFDLLLLLIFKDQIVGAGSEMGPKRFWQILLKGYLGV